MFFILLIALLSSTMALYLCFCKYLNAKVNIYSDTTDSSMETKRDRIILGLIAIASITWAAYLLH